ncbi:MAG: hypothetical protein AAB383_00610 [Patescibacteria group bacterium]
MTDTPTTPETPDVAAIAAAAGVEKPPVVPAGTELEFGAVVEKGVMSWIYDKMGGDKVILDYVEDNPDTLTSAMSLFGAQKSQIETREGLASLHITQRIGLLIYAQIKGAGDDDEESSESADEPAASKSLTEALKGKGKTLTFKDYQAYWAANPGAKAPVFPDSTHAIVKNADFDWVKISTALATKDKDVAKQWPKLFPYPAGSRVVMDKTPTDLQIFADSPVGKLALESMGLKMTVVPLGSTDKPADNEIQLVSLQDSDPMDPKNVEKVATMWDDGVPTQFAGAPKTVAAVQALKASKPETQATFDLQPSVSAAKAFLSEKGKPLEALDFDKTLVTKPGEPQFDKSFTFMTDAMHVGEHPNNAQLKKETVAWFISVPTKDGANAELLAFDASSKIIGFAD